MRPQHSETFASLMTAVAEYYGKTMSPELIRIYWDGLATYEFEEVKRVLNAHLHNPDTGQFMPKIADVVKFLEGNTITQAMRAWQKAALAVQSVGTYQTVVFDDPIIHAVITDMGGWPQMGVIDNDELPFKVREFEKRYQSYRLKPPLNHPRALIGILDTRNILQGYQPQIPILIGEAQAANLVYDGGTITQGIAVQSMSTLLPGSPNEPLIAKVPQLTKKAHARTMTQPKKGNQPYERK